MSFLGVDETKISRELIDEAALKLGPILDQFVVHLVQGLNKILVGKEITITIK